MFGLSFIELIFVALIGVLVFGPERLPAVSRKIGQWIGKWRGSVDNIQQEIAKELQYEEVERELQKAEQAFHSASDVISGREIKENAKKWLGEELGKNASYYADKDTDWFLPSAISIRSVNLAAPQRARNIRTCVLRKRSAAPILHRVVLLTPPQTRFRLIIRGLREASLDPHSTRRIPLRAAKENPKS
ncbi:MAG: Sec-independent protein translocase protein TatB [Bradymonadales bacterium]